jgi:hypothetical protein
MTARIQLIINQLIYNPKKLFLIDSLGAFSTAFFLTVILLRFENEFGAPRSALYFLSLVAYVYAIYSFCCSVFVSSKWRPYLKIITIANLAYCLLTIGLISYCYKNLTALGLIYFSLEILIIISLVYIEVIAQSKSINKNLK